jgi:hypothetical protein
LNAYHRKDRIFYVTYLLRSGRLSEYIGHFGLGNVKIMYPIKISAFAGMTDIFQLQHSLSKRRGILGFRMTNL